MFEVFEVNALAAAVATGIGAGLALRRVVQRPREIRYADALYTLARNRPKDDRIVSGAILIEGRGEKTMRVYLLYLDAENRPLADAKGHLYGTAMIVEALDEILSEKLGKGNDLLIVS